MMKKFNIVYEIVFMTLAIIAVTIAFLDITEKVNLLENNVLFYIDEIITYIFIFDYFIRLFLSNNKKTFLKSNIPDLIAIVPFTALFKMFRILKLLRFTKFSKVLKILKLFKIVGVSARMHKKIKSILKSNGLNYSLWFAMLVIFLGAIGIYATEKGVTVKSFQDAIWWSFVTSTTVGYGDISPSTQFGRVIAALLMLTGIGTIGMVTSSISVYFLKSNNSKVLNVEGEVVEELKEQAESLSSDEAKEVLNYINYLKSKR